MAFRLLRKIKYALFIVFIICLVTVFYLTSMGLPKAVVHKIEPYLQFSGMVLDLDRIKLSIFEGIVATSVKYYKKGDVGEPVIQAEKFVLKLEPLAWMRGGNGISGAIVKNGRAQFSPGGDAAGKITFDNIFADVLFDQPAARGASRGDAGGSRLKILSFATTFSGVKLSGKGTILIPSEKSTALKSDTAAPDLKNISSRLKDFISSNAVNVEVDFFVDPDNLEKLSVKADVHGRNTVYGGAVIGGWNANISVSGKSVKGNIALKNMEIEGLFIQSVNGLVQYDGKALASASLKSVVGGQGTRAGPLALQLKYDLSSDQFEGHATTECDLRAFVPLLRSFGLKLADIFAAFDFKRSLPLGDISIKGGLKPGFSCRINGEVLTDTLSFKTVSCLLIKVGFDVDLNETGEKVLIHPLLIVRDEGLARGQLIYDSDGEIISFSMMSMADPKAVATMIDPLVVSALEPFSFDGLCYITAFGKVGCTNSAPNDAEISFNASAARWKMLRFAPCALTLQMEERSYKVDDFNGSIYHGVINGSASLDPVADSTNMLFAISAKAANVDFGVLINALAGKQLESAYEGTCSGAVDLQGLLEDADRSSIKGNGWIKIENGRIFTVPLFSGMFDILGKVIPGMGTFNGKNNAQATLTVANGKVRGRNIYIDGDVFSLEGSGDVYLDGRLDLKVQISFGRRHSLIGNLVQVITMPLRKALELHLGGTLSNPKWESSFLRF